MRLMDRLDEDGRRDARADLDRTKERSARRIVWVLFKGARGASGGPLRLGCSFVDVIKLGMPWKWLFVEGSGERVEASSPKHMTTRPMTWTWTATGRRSACKYRPNISGRLFSRDRRPRATCSLVVHDEASESRRRELEKSAVADMLREREALRSRLDALTREKRTSRKS